MGVININDIQPGMAVARDVCNARGQLLLKAGSVIEERELLLLKTWGVTEAEIEGADRGAVSQKSLEGVDREKLEKVKADLENRFSGTLDSEVMQEVMRIVLKQKLQELSPGFTQK